MLVAETFRSLQGEGALLGVPSFFIRTSGCALRCRWCDTPYTSWRPEGSVRSAADLVDEARAARMRHVVVTGGEPLVQRDIGELTRGLRGCGLHVTVETAGVAAPEMECDLLSVSPKTSSSDPEGAWLERHRSRRADTEPLIALLRRFPEHQIKLVIQQPSDMDEVLELLSRIGQVAPERVLLMPEGTTAAQVAARAPMVAALCLEHGFRYTPRLHLDLFGGGRGV